MDIPWLPKWSVQLGAVALREGERVPWYMGPAWYLPYTDRMVFMPMPINLMAAWCRRVWIRARRIEIADEIAGAYRYGYAKGFSEGRDHGYDMGIRHTKLLFGATCGATSPTDAKRAAAPAAMLLASGAARTTEGGDAEMIERQPTREAIQKCAEWLAACIRLGWKKSELDALEAIWWKYHDHRGRLISDVRRAVAVKVSTEQSGGDRR